MIATSEKVRSEVDVSRETYDTLRAYSAAILKWTGRINLIARSDATPEIVWTRHIEDARQIIPLIPDGVNRAIDLGSGAGLPGMVLAIERRDIAVTMIEADRRKAAFLQTMVADLAISATVLAERIEAANAAQAQLITARALAPLPKLLEYATRFLAEGGTCIFLKGGTAESELEAAASDWRMRVERFPSRTAPGSTLLRLSEIQRVT